MKLALVAVLGILVGLAAWGIYGGPRTARERILAKIEKELPWKSTLLTPR